MKPQSNPPDQVLLDKQQPAKVNNKNTLPPGFLKYPPQTYAAHPGLHL